MDQKTLVNRKIENGRRLTNALRRDPKLGLVAGFWWFDADAERWALVVACELYRTDGPRAAYKAVEKHIRRLEPKRAAGSFLDLNDVVAVSDRDQRVRALASAVRVTDGDVRIQASVLNGVYVTDAIVYELDTSPGPEREQGVGSTSIAYSA